MPQSLPWKIRGLQIDLARKMETLDFIRSQADFAAEQGFNTLVLYLEGRVRTKSFPFRPREESYTLREMETVVRHAASAGMTVVPVVSTLGHTEQFLHCKELVHLAESRDGKARFGEPSPGVFCPSLDGTYEFFEKYFGELAEVFPGPWWHVGLDEDWDMGFCNTCRERWTKSGLGSIFTDHLQRVERIVRGLGKRPWMWDDMFELFPGELANVPKSVVMAHWVYDDVVEPEGSQAHFVNRWRHDWLAEYQRLGLDAVICPWYQPSARNIEMLTDYARRRRVLGGFLTQWGFSPRTHAVNRAVVAFTGKLWSAKTYDPQRAWAEAASTAVPDAEPPLAHAITVLSRATLQVPSGSPGNYLRGPLSAEDEADRAAVSLALEILVGAGRASLRSELPALGRTTEAGRIIELPAPRFTTISARKARGRQLADSTCPYRAEKAPPANDPGDIFLEYLEWSAQMHLLYWELRELIPAIYNPRRLPEDAPLLAERARTVQDELRRLLQLRESNAERWQLRQHPSDARTDAWLQSFPANLAPAWKRLKRQPAAKDWMLVLRLHLQDYYGAPHLKVSLTIGAKKLTVLDGNIKHPSASAGRLGGHYDVRVPFTAPKAPDGVRLEGGGYGGQGVAFVELQNPAITLLPDSIREISGPVSRPEAILRDDSSHALLGRPDILAEIHYPELAQQRGVIDVGVRRR